MKSDDDDDDDDDGQVLSSVPEARYLVIMVTDELSWSSHVQSIYSKANSTFTFLRRNLRRCLTKLEESAYISLVRSTLEYATSVWDPHLAKDISELENIQRRSARFVKGDYHTTSSVTQMLQELGWQDLQSRCRDLRLALPVLYKVVMGHVGIQLEHVGLVAADDRTRAKHQFKFHAVGSSTQAFRHSCGLNCRRLELASVPCGGTANRSIFQDGAVQVDVGRIRTVKRHPHSRDTPRGGL